MINPGDYGLNDQEYQTILQKLGREPNHIEMGIFSAMWSEHCSYKHTRPLFKLFPTQAEWVLQGPGENAGVVAIDSQWAVVFKIESHNHPSFVAPYDGASTGVGGLLRDIMAMGARPVGVKALLRSGPLDDPRTRQMVEQIQRGAADYAAACGVAFLGTELITHPSYATNPLVNVLVLGLARIDSLAQSGAGEPGNLLLYYGRPTGTEGVNGATFASKGMDEETEAHPPAGDAALGKDLMDATLELIEQKLVAGIQDMGAAGLTCSSFEMAHKAGHGFTLDLDQVPVERPGLSPDVLLLSETQERMLAAVTPEALPQAQAVLAKYPRLTCQVIGRVEAEPLGRLSAGGRVCAELAPDIVVDGFPRYTLGGEPSEAKAYVEPLKREENNNHFIEVAAPKKQPAQASRLAVTSTHMINDHCAQIHFAENGKTILLSTRCNGPDILHEPYVSAHKLVTLACQDLKAAGARPLGLTDGLNFGNPDRPEIAFQIREAVRGIAEACKLEKVPVIGGNVSLYNETNESPILGQVFIGMVGVKE